MSKRIQFDDQTLAADDIAGEERLGAPFRYVAALHSASDLDAYLGRAVTLQLEGRAIHGIVSCVERVGPDRYDVEVVPALWLMSLTRRNETYRDLSVPEIVAAAVATSGVPLEVRSHLSRSYPPRASVVQRDETDLELVRRLLREAGIRFVVEHDGESEALVLYDRAEQHSRSRAEPRALRRKSRLGCATVFSGEIAGDLRAGQIVALGEGDVLVTRVRSQNGETRFEAIPADTEISPAIPPNRPAVIIEAGPSVPTWEATTHDALGPLHYGDTEVADVSTTTGENDTWLRFAVPHTKSADDTKGTWTYLRIGEAAHNSSVSASDGRTAWKEKDSTSDFEINSFNNTDMAGVFDYTDHYRTVYTRKDKEEYIRGDYRVTVAGGDSSPVYDEHITSAFIFDAAYVNQLEVSQGFHFTVDSGLRSETFIGLHNENHIMGKLDITVANDLSFFAGYKQEVVRGDSITYRKGEELRMSQSEDVRALEKIELCIEPARADSLIDKAEIAMGVVAALGTATLGLSSLANSDAVTGATTGAIGAAYIGGMIACRLLDKGRELADGDPFMGMNKKPTGDKDILLYCDEFRFYTSNQLDKLLIDDNVVKLPTVDGRQASMAADSAGIEILTAAAASGKSLTLQCGKAKIILKDDGITLEGVNVTIKEELDVTKAARKGGKNITCDP